METKLKRNKDGTVKGVITMGDVLKKDSFKEADERQRRKEEYEKKHNIK